MSTLKTGTVQNNTGTGAPLFKNNSGTEIGQLVRAYANFDGTFGTSPFTEANGGIRDSFNVTSVTDVGTGQYTVNFTNALSSSNYVVVGMNHYGISHRGTSPFSTTSFDVVTYNTSSAANTDYDYNDLAFFD